MVSRSTMKKIEALKKGDIIHVKEPQKVSYPSSYNQGWPIYKTIQPSDEIRVHCSKAPYIYKQEGRHQCFVAGWALLNGEEHHCTIHYENVQL